MRKVSVIIPVVRPRLAVRCVAAIHNNSGMPKKHYEIITEYDEDRTGCPKMVQRLVLKSQYNLMMFLGDDTVPQKDFMINAVRAMEGLPDGFGLVGLNDLYHDGNNLATHWLADKRLLPLIGGEFFHTGYWHGMCDVELTERCKALERYVWAKDAILRHDNPLCNYRVGQDHTEYDRVYSEEYLEHDRKLFESRTHLWRKAK